LKATIRSVTSSVPAASAMFPPHHSGTQITQHSRITSVRRWEPEEDEGGGKGETLVEQ
jgi:hypothetical protein